MIFTETALRGAYIIDMKRIEDERGFFARGWCRKEFEDLGLNGNLVQLNVGYSTAKGTVRGLHFQDAPYAEMKLVRCTRGAIYDVIVDLLSGAPKTWRQWLTITSAPSPCALSSPSSEPFVVWGH